MLTKIYVKNQGRNIGSITTGFDGAFESLVRDEDGSVLGRCSQRFQNTRDARGVLISTNAADPGLLIKRR